MSILTHSSLLHVSMWWSQWTFQMEKDITWTETGIYSSTPPNCALSISNVRKVNNKIKSLIYY